IEGADGRVCKSSGVLENGDKRDFDAGRERARISAIGPAKDKSVYARRSGGFCAQELPGSARFARTSPLGGGRCNCSANELPASDRCSVAVEQSHGQQYYRAHPTELRNCTDYRAGPSGDVEPQRLGERGWIVVFLGASRLRVSRGEGGRGAR